MQRGRVRLPLRLRCARYVRGRTDYSPRCATPDVEHAIPQVSHDDCFLSKGSADAAATALLFEDRAL
eukprot:9026758-Alexandrium_andersonii.AAC.1